MKPKKSLGQNFLKSNMALQKIVAAGKVNNGGIVLEIGPGKGILTSRLLGAGAKVIAVEKDRELFEFLQEKFAGEIKSRSLVLVHDDILELDIRKVVRQGLTTRLTTQDTTFLTTMPYKIIANIPYNITGAILKKFLTAENQPTLMVLMVQHEVAKRILASDKKESLLSISVKAYGKPKMITKVEARYFSPKPKVDSAVIAIEDISRKFFKDNNIEEEKFWKIVKVGFAHKRKKLTSNLKTSGYGDPSNVGDFDNKRAEELSLLDWILLTK